MDNSHLLVIAINDEIPPAEEISECKIEHKVKKVQENVTIKMELGTIIREKTDNFLGNQKKVGHVTWTAFIKAKDPKYRYLTDKLIRKVDLLLDDNLV